MIRDCVQDIVKPLVKTITGDLFDILSLGPLAWWDMTDSSTITESGGLVSQVDDKSGNSNHATQTTAIDQPPTYTTSDGYDGLDMTGDTFMSALSIPNVKTIIGIFTLETGNEIAFIAASSGGQEELFFRNSGDEVSFDGAGITAQGKYSIDGSAFSGFATNHAGPGLTNGLATLGIGVYQNTIAVEDLFNRPGFFNNSRAVIHEVVLLDRELTSAEKTAVDTYYLNKYSI